jgi:rod shape-determining protein MreC
MNELFLFIARSKAFLIFVFLEIFALWCVYRFNNYGSAILFNTTSTVVATAVEKQNAAIRYTKLNKINEDLAKENVKLNALVTRLQNQIPKDSLHQTKIDTSMANRYEMEYAEAINFTINLPNNYITINKGSSDGLSANMGVISSTGVVGKIKMCSPHMALVTSILHSENLVSSKIIKAGKSKLGSVKWDGLNPHEAEMLYMDIFEPIQKGDTVLTSDLNKIYPPNIMVGIVKKVSASKGQQFWNITLELSTDFKNLAYVYVVKNKFIDEQQSLEESPTKK